MPLFGRRSAGAMVVMTPPPPSDAGSGVHPPGSSGGDLVRMLSGRPTKEHEMIQQVLWQQQAAQAAAVERERVAVRDVAEREQRMRAKIAQLQSQLQESQEEVLRAHKAEEDLQKALRRAAEKLGQASSDEGGLKQEIEDTRGELHECQLEVQTLRARLYGEKGVVLGAIDVGPRGAVPDRPRSDASGEHENDVIRSIVTGTTPAARDAPNVSEGRATAQRHARQQLKRLLHFVKAQLADDLAAYKGATDADQAAAMTDVVGKRRALVTKLENALYDLVGGLQAHSGKGGGGGSGWAPRVHGASLPRTVAVNENAMRPVLLTSGPAAKWLLRPHDPAAAPPSPGGAAAIGATDDDVLRWTAGETLMLVVEAVDEGGNVDTDYDSVVLLETESHVSGRGLVRVTKGVGLVSLVAKKAGPVEIQVPPLPITR